MTGKTAPKVFTQHARNPERNVQIGGKATVFAPVYGPPFVRDLDGVRRYATLDDFKNFVRLAYMAPSIHHSGGTVCEPVDVPVNKRHLDMVLAHMTLSDKPFMGSVTAPERAADTVDMCRILFGSDFVDKNCVVINLINANSPMTFDGTMLGAAKVYARANQATDQFLEQYYGVKAAIMRKLTLCYAGPRSGVSEWLGRYVAAGASHLVLRFVGHHERHLEVLSGIGGELAP